MSLNVTSSLTSEDDSNENFGGVDLPNTVRYIWTAYLIIIICLGVPGNLIIAIVYSRIKSKTTCDWYILFMGITDFTVCLISPLLYLRTEYNIEILLHRGSCGIEHWLQLTAMTSSSNFLTAIALDRYLKVCQTRIPPVKPPAAPYACMLTLVFSGALSIFPTLESFDKKECAMFDPNNISAESKIYFTAIFVAYTICFIIVVFAYGNVCNQIFQKVKNKQRLLENNGLVKSSDTDTMAFHRTGCCGRFFTNTPSGFVRNKCWRRTFCCLKDYSENLSSRKDSNKPNGDHAVVTYSADGNGKDVVVLKEMKNGSGLFRAVDLDIKNGTDIKSLNSHTTDAQQAPMILINARPLSCLYITDNLHIQRDDVSFRSDSEVPAQVPYEVMDSTSRDGDCYEERTHESVADHNSKFSISQNNSKLPSPNIHVNMICIDNTDLSPETWVENICNGGVSGSSSSSELARENKCLIGPGVKCLSELDPKHSDTDPLNSQDIIDGDGECETKKPQQQFIIKKGAEEKRIAFRLSRTPTTSIEHPEVSKTTEFNTTDINQAGEKSKGMVISQTCSEITNINPNVSSLYQNNRDQNNKTSERTPILGPDNESKWTELSKGGAQTKGKITSKTTLDEPDPSAKGTKMALKGVQSLSVESTKDEEIEEDLPTGAFMKRWLSQKRRKNFAHAKQSSASSKSTTSSRERFAREKQITFMLISVTLTFILASAPSWAVWVTMMWTPSALQDGLTTRLIVTATVGVFLLNFISSWCIFYTFNPTFKRRCHELFPCLPGGEDGESGRVEI